YTRWLSPRRSEPCVLLNRRCAWSGAVTFNGDRTQKARSKAGVNRAGLSLRIGGVGNLVQIPGNADNRQAGAAIGQELRAQTPGAVSVQNTLIPTLFDELRNKHGDAPAREFRLELLHDPQHRFVH